VTTVTSAVTDAATNAAAAVTTAVNDTWNAATSTVSDLWNVASTDATDVLNAASNAATDLWNTVSSTASDGWNVVSTAASDTWDAVAVTANDFASVATDTWNAASSAATDAWTTGTEAAKAILRDAIYTTGDAVGAINDTVANFALGVARQTAYDIAAVDGKVQTGDYLGAFVDLYAGLVLATGGGPLMGMATKAAMAVARPLLGRLVGPLMSGASRLLGRLLAKGTTEAVETSGQIVQRVAQEQADLGRDYWLTKLSRKQIDAIADNPGLENAYIGTKIHKATFDALNEIYPERFRYYRVGVDFYDETTGTFVELTTPKGLVGHAEDYASQVFHPKNGLAMDVIEFMPYVLK
jgi:hypothetical protein